MFPAFFVIWVVLNGRWTLEIALIGLIVSAGMELLTCRMLGYSLKSEPHRLMTGLRLLLFYPVLIYEMAKCSLSVIRLILHPQEEVSPELFYFHGNLRTATFRVLLANAITLTPGTIIVELSESGAYRVHALDASFAEGIDKSDLVRALERAEGGHNVD